jgi:hypothetical protein
VRKWIFVFIGISICLVLNACTSSGNTSDSTVGSVQAEIEEVAPAAEMETDEEEVSEMTLKMSIGDTLVQVDWEKNESVEALKKLCADELLTIKMSMYGGFEQVGSIGSTLPRNDKQTTTAAGDIVLYSSDKIVVFYGSNSWSYTRLGKINMSQKELEQLLGSGDVTVTLSVE